MTIYVNDKNEIKDVGATLDSTLIPIEVTDGTFDNWCIAKICCYKVNVVDGNVTMLTPYVDSRLIEHFDQIGSQVPYVESKKVYIDDTECVFTTNKEGSVSATCISESGKVIPIIYEVIGSNVVVRFDKLSEVATVTITIV